MNAMRELVVMERSTVRENGRLVLRERQCYGVAREDGGVQLLAYRGKRVPLEPCGVLSARDDAQEQTSGHAA